MTKIKIHYIDAYQLMFECLEQTSKEEMIEFFHLSKKAQKKYHFPSQNIYHKKERITITFPIEYFEINKMKEIEVIYEDEMLLVVNKPPFLLVHSDGQKDDSLQDRVNYYLDQNQWPHKAQALHRLDYETSGLVLFSKNPFFQPCFDAMIASHQLKKQYLCIVEGQFPYRKKRIEKNIARNRHNAKAMIVHPNGKKAQTDIICIAQSNNCSLLKVWIKTGRKHQIRVHCSSIDYPLINDSIYGHVKDHRGLLLQAQCIEFIHPINQETIHLQLAMDSRFTKEFDNKYDIQNKGK